MRARNLPGPTVLAMIAFVGYASETNLTFFVTIPVVLLILLYGSWYETQLITKEGPNAEGK